jgi:hypothetical protein
VITGTPVHHGYARVGADGAGLPHDFDASVSKHDVELLLHDTGWIARFGGLIRSPSTMDQQSSTDEEKAWEEAEVGMRFHG